MRFVPSLVTMEMPQGMPRWILVAIILELPLLEIRKKPFKLDLVALHAICEANYARFLRLFPEYENCNVRELQVGSARIRLEVVERCRYTTIFKIQQNQASSRWLGHLNIEVRAYHDARMLEVGMFQSHRRIAARYQYPNDKMYQQDEKYQQNGFLADWLEHSLQNGRAAVDFSTSTSSS
jgi:uncharacterized protein YqiB (DUF1249 family)